MRLGDRTAEGYTLLLSSAFLLAAPYFAAGGGYTRISGFKALLYVLLTLPFLLTGFMDRPGLRALTRGPERVLTLLWLFFCLLSALFSPWRRTAFSGGSRQEGFLHLALYGLSFLLLSLRRSRKEILLPVFAAGILLLDALSLLQLLGRNPLGLYPPGMGWADANLRYAGAYLGTVGNAGQTGAVLTAAAALLFLSILEKGGKRWLLLPLLLFTAWILGGMDQTAPMLALGILALLCLPLCGSLQRLCRWLCAVPLSAGALLGRLLPPGAGLFLAGAALGAWLLLRLGPGERPARAWSLCLFVLLPVLGLLFLYRYEGWYAPLAEAGRLLRGELSEGMGSGRVYIWTQVLGAAKEHLLLGTGPDTLSLRQLAPYRYYSEEAGRLVTLSIDAAHSEVLQTLVCCGLPAAFCHLGLFFCAGLRFFLGREAGRVCAGAALAYALQAMFGISMCASAPIFWVLLALSISEEGGGFLANAPDPGQ